MLCLLESVIMSAIFDLQLPAGGVHMIRKREERRQRKHRRYYQGDDLDDAG